MRYVFKLEHEKVLLREIYDMKNFQKQVDLVSSTIVTKNKLINMFIFIYDILKMLKGKVKIHISVELVMMN